MATSLKTLGAGLAALLVLALALTGCGGGGGIGGGIQTGNLTNPAAAYTGVTTQATVSTVNAENLAMGGYGSGDFIANIALFSLDKNAAVDNEGRRFPILPALQLVKNSLRAMDIPGKAALRGPSAEKSGSVKMSATEEYQIPGPNGGVANFTLHLNEATGSFSGTVVYQDFTDGWMAINGRAELQGSLDPSGQFYSRLSLSFSALSFTSSEYTLTLVGSLSWGFDHNAWSEALTIDLTLIDQGNAQTYWLNNYQIQTIYGNESYTQTFSGRYYNHDHGYVDLETLSPLVSYYGYSWPSAGSLHFSGTLGSWVRMKCLPTTMVLEADTDGNGTPDWEVEWMTNYQPGPNLPPTANAGPDQTVTQWTTVQLDGSASSDPDGDTLYYHWYVESAPNYSYPALSDYSSPRTSFSAEAAGTYVLTLMVYDGYSASQADSVTVVVTPVAASNPTLLQQQWQFGIFGANIGKAGLLTTDLDSDGTPEIIASASSGDHFMWYVIRQTATGKFEQIWRSENFAVTLVRLTLADLTGDGKQDVVAALTDGSIHIYDGPTLNKIKTIRLGVFVADLAIADLDGDGQLELITSDGVGIAVFSADSGLLKWSLSSSGGNSLAVGNVDADPALEIVTTTHGGRGYVIDGVSTLSQWEYVNSFGSKVQLADLDDDSMQEIVGASAWYKITIFDADRKTPVWEITTDLDISALLVSDVDGDNVPEIIYGDGQWGQIHAYDVRTRTKRWALPNLGHSVSGIGTGDVDLDGKREVYWGSNGYWDVPNFSIADPLTGTIKWSNRDLIGLSALSVGDVDDDGVDEIVMVSASSNSSAEDGVISIFNAQTHELKYQKKIGLRDWNAVRSVVIGDVDGDGKTEFVITAVDSYGGVIQVYDGASQALKRQSAKHDGAVFSALALADIDNDGKVEIVAGQSRTYSSGPSAILLVFDGTTLQEEWRSVSLGAYSNPVYDIVIADLDRDGKQEIIASIDNHRLVIFDGVDHTLKLMAESPAKALEVADIDGDGFAEILVGRQDGKIDILDGQTYTFKKSLFTLNYGPVDALRVTDLDGNGSKEWLVTSGGTLTIWENEQLKWRSPNLGQNLGLRNHLEIKDADGDGRKEVFVGSDMALYHFK